MSMNTKESKRVSKSGAGINKSHIMPIIVLCVICLVASALLALVNSFTAPVIADYEETKIQESLGKVIEGTPVPVSPLPAGVPETVTAMYEIMRDGTLAGHAVTVSVKGYASQIYMTVGIDADGKVTKAMITSQAESHGKAGMDDYTDLYAGVGAESIHGVELFTGATVSSTAIKDGITDALRAVVGEVHEPVEAEPPAIESNPVAKGVGIAIICAAAVISVACAVIIKIKRRKNG